MLVGQFELGKVDIKTAPERQNAVGRGYARTQTGAAVFWRGAQAGAGFSLP